MCEISSCCLNCVKLYFRLVELDGNPALANFCMPGDTVEKDSPLRYSLAVENNCLLPYEKWEFSIVQNNKSYS